MLHLDQLLKRRLLRDLDFGLGPTLFPEQFMSRQVLLLRSAKQLRNSDHLVKRRLILSPDCSTLAHVSCGDLFVSNRRKIRHREIVA